MEDSEKLRAEVKRIGRSFIINKLEKQKISKYAFKQALNRGKMSLKMSLAMQDITNIATNFWQAPGIHNPDGSMIETKTSA